MSEIASIRLLLSRADNADSTEAALDLAVGAYKEAAGYVTALEELQRSIKDLIGEVFTETGATEAVTSAGKAYVTRPGVTVRYDAKGLDAACKADPDLASKLAPFRTEAERPGVLTVR